MSKKKSQRAPQYWLLKTEPQSYSIADLCGEPQQRTFWDGVRNYQARNFLRDSMHPGDLAFFYHSNASPPAITGIVKIISEGYPDPTACDPDHHHYDPKSTASNPRWFMVDVELVERFDAPIGLDVLRGVPSLRGMELLRKGSRLSVQPVRPAEFQAIVKLAHQRSH